MLQVFGLDRPALTWIKPNAQSAMLFEDGSSVVLSHMVNDTKDSISKYSFKDAVTFGKVIRRWRRIVNEILAPATYIPPMAPLEITMAMQRTDGHRASCGPNPWGAVGLEWETASPPPTFNFVEQPVVDHEAYQYVRVEAQVVH